MAEFSVEVVFNRILKREMETLLAEKQKQCQSGAILDLAADRLTEAYFLKKQYEYEKGAHNSEKSYRISQTEELERVRESLRKAKEAIG